MRFSPAIDLDATLLEAWRTAFWEALDLCAIDRGHHSINDVIGYDWARQRNRGQWPTLSKIASVLEQLGITPVDFAARVDGLLNLKKTRPAA
jgi:hypothetical protein